MDFFVAETPVTGVFFFRIFLALWSIFFWVPRLSHVWELYSRPVLRHVHRVIKWLDHPLPASSFVGAVLVSLLVLLVLVAGAKRPRVFHLLLLAPLSLLYVLDTLMARAYGALAFIQWWLLFIAPYDRLRGDDGNILRGPNTGQRLLQVQWACVYLFTVPAKLWGGRGWLDGSVLWRTFHGTRYGDWLLSHLFDIPLWLCAVACYTVLATELFIAIGIWFARTRHLAIISCVVLHVSMTLFLRVSPLFPALMIGHLLLFIRPDEYERLLLACKTRFRKLRADTGA